MCLKPLLIFRDYELVVQNSLDVEWLLSTLFDASLYIHCKPPPGGFFFGSIAALRPPHLPVFLKR